MLNNAVQSEERSGIEPVRWWRGAQGELILYSGAILLGAVLITLTCMWQPYNQNEWAQIETYGSSDPSVIVSGTRQPPLDPLLGALVQHLLGVGQLRQRLVPAVAGIGSLVVMAGLLRRMRLGRVGVLALFLMATAPAFVRYSAYIRPYGVPLFLMLACCYAGSRWLDDGRRRWLVAAAVPALLLPLSRVPEPLVFLGTSMVVLVWAGWRGTLPRVRAWSLAGTLLLTIATVGLVMLRTLESKTAASAGQSGHVFDASPVHALERSGTGLREVWNYVLPLLAHWFPWWPVTLAVLVLAALLRDARRTLQGTWFWLPLLAAPLVFLVAYHTFNPYPLDIRHYRARFAYFFVPPLILLAAAVGHSIARSAAAKRWGAWLGSAVVALLLVSQLPTTAAVLTENDVPAFGQAGAVLRKEVPRNAVVLYDSPAPGHMWRQPFFGKPRYLVGAPKVYSVTKLAKGTGHIRRPGPVYLLILDSECASSVVCDMPHRDWKEEVPGFRAVKRFDRFTLYAPVEGQRGAQGTIDALSRLSEAYGPTMATLDTYAEAWLLKSTGQPALAHQRIEEQCSQLDGAAAKGCYGGAAKADLYPSGAGPGR